MAIKNIIAQGIGFTPGSIKYIPTLGFDIAAFVAPPSAPFTPSTFEKAAMSYPDEAFIGTSTLVRVRNLYWRATGVS
jgi:hypothetical protein